MSHERNMKWLNNRKVIYQRNPITDIPTESNNLYDYYAEGTYQCYSLFRSTAKINTYKSLKWHFLVLYYLNIEGIEGDEISLEDDMRYIFKFIANKENGFVTFFIKTKTLNHMIQEVLGVGDTPPRNRIRKVIFKDYTGLSLSEKLSIVGKLIGRSKKVYEDDIYQCMIDLNDNKKKITIAKLAKSLECSTRTIYRNMGNQLKQEKEILNREL
ncbi:MAG: HTH domain-containing protein [Pelagibacterales bacterium]|nr:HTH domain-containing protein [Pelagibacterales bacterium]